MAVRQVAPELLNEMGEPFGQLWKLLEAAHGPEDAARAFSRVLGAILAHGEAPVREAVSVAVEADKVDLLGLGSQLHGPVARAVPIPAALAGIEIEQGRASDYDHLLEVKP